MSSFFGASETKTKQESKGTSTSTANLDKKQGKLNKALFDQIMAIVTGGPKASQANINQGRSAINDTYDATAKNLESNLAARGFGGPGGKLGQGYGDLAIARNKAIATSDATEQDRALENFQRFIQNAFQFNQPRSTTTTSSGTNVNTQPGPSIFDRILGYAGQGLGGAIGLGYQPFR